LTALLELVRCEVCGSPISTVGIGDMTVCRSCKSIYQLVNPEEVVQTKLFTVKMAPAPPPKKADFVEFYSKDEAPAGHVFIAGELCSGSIINLQDRWDWFYLRVIDEDTGQEVCREPAPGYLWPGGTRGFYLPHEVDVGRVIMPERDWNLRCEIVLWWLI